MSNNTRSVWIPMPGDTIIATSMVACIDENGEDVEVYAQMRLRGAGTPFYAIDIGNNTYTFEDVYVASHYWREHTQ